MPIVNLLSTSSAAGLGRDARLVTDALEGAGFEVVLTWLRPLGRAESLGTRLAGLRPARYDLNLFLEAVEPAWFGHARRNAVLPNPEWWAQPARLLRRLDLVLCKTRSAVSWLGWHGARCRWVGFASVDHWLGPALAAEADPVRPLHLAGTSNQKGTRELVEVWSRRPDWPELTVVASFRPGHPTVDWTRPNVRHLATPLAEDELRRLQNQSALHLCPSTAEGYGHTIGEALGCGAVVVTSAAPPMDELVTAERGLLAPVAGFEPMRLGYRARLSPAALEATVERALALSPDERRRLGQEARTWFAANAAEFPGRLVAAVQDLIR